MKRFKAEQAALRKAAMDRAVLLGRSYFHVGGSAWECLRCGGPLSATCDCCAPTPCNCCLTA